MASSNPNHLSKTPAPHTTASGVYGITVNLETWGWGRTNFWSMPQMPRLTGPFTFPSYALLNEDLS